MITLIDIFTFFDEGIFDEGIFDEVIFDEVIFDEVIFDDVSDSHWGVDASI